MNIETDTIHVWHGTLDITNEQSEAMMAILSEKEQEKANRFHFPHHRLHYIAAHYHFRKLIAMYANCEPSMIQFGSNQFRKPILLAPSDTGLQFNMSHSDNVVIFGFGLHHELGIDIEISRTKRDLELIAESFAPSEIAKLAMLQGSEKSDAFYRIWTRKEAVMKATGRGLALSLSSFTVSTDHTPDLISVYNQKWKICSIEVPPGVCAALAYHPSVKNIEVKTLKCS